MNAHTILLVEDESSIADTIIYALKADGFDVVWVSLGQEALEQLSLVATESAEKTQTSQSVFSLVLLDVGLPDISGFEVCKLIRAQHTLPVVFLTARGDEIDRVVGLEIGADDYVVKPFSPRELVARVRAILRRGPLIESANISSEQSSACKDASVNKLASEFVIDEASRAISFYGQSLDLTRYEYGMLVFLLSRAGHVFTREQLLDAVWVEPEASYDRVVDTHIKTLRAKLRAVNSLVDPLKTHRGVGYSIASNTYEAE